MVKEKEIEIKSNRLQIRALTTHEDIIQFFKNNESSNKLKISIKQCIDANDFLKLAISLLIQNECITDFSLKFQNIKNIDCSDSMIKLQNIKRLQCFSLQILTNVELFSSRNNTFGETLKNFFNLKVLKIELQSSNIIKNGDQMIFKEVFVNLKELSFLNITIHKNEQSSLAIKCIFEGLRNLTNLHHLSFTLKDRFGCDENYYIFCDELRHQINLKVLELNLLSLEKLTVSKQILLQNAILSLINLENLMVKLYLDQSYQGSIFNGLESLRNLKKLSFGNYDSATLELLTKYLQDINKCSQLDNIQLQIKFSPPFDQQAINDLTQSILVLKNITMLEFDSCDSYWHEGCNILSLIEGLKNSKLEKLENLSLKSHYQQLYPLNTDQQIYTVFENVKGSLKQFNAFIYNGDSDDLPMNDYIQLIQLLIQFKYCEKISLVFTHYLNWVVFREFIPFHNIVKYNNNLTEIDLQFCSSQKYSEDELQKFFEIIQKRPKLKKLVLVDKGVNHISNETIYTMSEALGKLKNLEVLQLQLQELEFKNKSDFYYFLNTIKLIKQLKSLELQLNCLEKIENVFTLISDALFHMQQLQRLSLNMNLVNLNSQSKKIIFFPKTIKYLEIIINENEAEFGQALQLFESISRLPILRHLNIEISITPFNNNKHFEEIENVLSRLINLESLKLNLNSIKAIYFMKLFQPLPFLKSLELNQKTDYQENSNIVCQRIQNDSGDKFGIGENENYKEIDKSNYTDYYLLNMKVENYIEQNTEEIEIVKQTFKNLQLKIPQISLLITKDEHVKFFKCLSQLSQLIDLSIQIEIFSKLSYDEAVQVFSQLKFYQQLQKFRFQIHSQNMFITSLISKDTFVGLKEISKLREFIFVINDQYLNIEQGLDFIFENINHFKDLIRLQINLSCFNIISSPQISDQISQCVFVLPQLIDINFNFSCFQSLDLIQRKNLYKCFENCKNLRKIMIGVEKGYKQIPFFYKMKQLVTINNE